VQVSAFICGQDFPASLRRQAQFLLEAGQTDLIDDLAHAALFARRLEPVQDPLAHGGPHQAQVLDGGLGAVVGAAGDADLELVGQGQTVVFLVQFELQPHGVLHPQPAIGGAGADLDGADAEADGVSLLIALNNGPF